jgi:hypothetical protein
MSNLPYNASNLPYHNLPYSTSDLPYNNLPYNTSNPPYLNLPYKKSAACIMSRITSSNAQVGHINLK